MIDFKLHIKNVSKYISGCLVLSSYCIGYMLLELAMLKCTQKFKYGGPLVFSKNILGVLDKCCPIKNCARNSELIRILWKYRRHSV